MCYGIYIISFQNNTHLVSVQDSIYKCFWRKLLPPPALPIGIVSWVLQSALLRKKEEEGDTGRYFSIL